MTVFICSAITSREEKTWRSSRLSPGRRWGRPRYDRCHIRLGRERRGTSSLRVPREEVGLPQRLHRTYREEVAGPKLVFGGGDTREEVGAAAVPITPKRLQGGGRYGVDLMHLNREECASNSLTICRMQLQVRPF